MDVEFCDAQLALVETEQAAECGLPVAVIRAVRVKLNIIRAAPDEHTLVSWKSLNYRRFERESGVTGYVTLNEGWRLMLRLDERSVPNRVAIVEARRIQRSGDKHAEILPS